MLEITAVAVAYASAMMGLDSVMFSAGHNELVHDLRSVVRLNVFQATYGLEDYIPFDEMPIHVQDSALEWAELQQDPTGVDCFERYDGVDQ